MLTGALNTRSQSRGWSVIQFFFSFTSQCYVPVDCGKDPAAYTLYEPSAVCGAKSILYHLKERVNDNKDNQLVKCLECNVFARSINKHVYRLRNR